MADKRAAIDLGTNTALLLVAETDAEGAVTTVLEDVSRIVKLGQGVDATRELQAEAIDRARAALAEFHNLVAGHGLLPEDVVAVATATARDAKNGEKFFAGIAKDYGFRFWTLSGEEEARYSFLGGLLPTTAPETSAVIDIGGGSTELQSRSGGLSLDMGSVRFTERYLKSDPVTDEEFWAAEEACDRELERAKAWRQGTTRDLQLVGVAGTVVNLGSLHLGLQRFDRDQLDGLILTRGDVHRLVEELKWRSVAERVVMPGLEPGRGDVILAGALILWRAMEKLDFGSVRISTRGLRYGVLRLV